MKDIINIIFLLLILLTSASIIVFFISNFRYMDKIKESYFCVDFKETTMIVIDKYSTNNSKKKKKENNKNNKKSKSNSNDEIYCIVFQEVSNPENKITENVSKEEFKKIFLGDKKSTYTSIYKNKDIFFEVREEYNWDNINGYHKEIDRYNECPDYKKDYFKKNKDIFLKKCEESVINKNKEIKSKYITMIIVLIISILLFIVTK